MAGVGGLGGGGDAQSTYPTRTGGLGGAQHGVGGTGGGGGGAARFEPAPAGPQLGANGGSGVCVIRYQIGGLSGTAKATGGMISYKDGKVIHQFLSSGEFTVTNPTLTSINYLVVGGGGGGGTLRLEEFPVVNNGSADVTLSQAFTLSQLDVYLNGARLKSTTDFTISGTTLTFSNTLSTGDVVAVYIYDTSTVLSLVTGDWGSLNDVNVTGQAKNTLNKFNGTAYVPALTTEDGSGNITVTGTVTATSIQGDARDDIIEISTALALALGF